MLRKSFACEKFHKHRLIWLPETFKVATLDARIVAAASLFPASQPDLTLTDGKHFSAQQQPAAP
jgi:hypothetical protein